jgi:hypothetical protein
VSNSERAADIVLLVVEMAAELDAAGPLAR